MPSGGRGVKANAGVSLVKDALANLKTALLSINETQAKYSKVKNSIDTTNVTTSKSHRQLVISLDHLLRTKINRLLVCTADFKKIMWDSWRCMGKSVNTADKKVRERNVDFDYSKSSLVFCEFRGT